MESEKDKQSQHMTELIQLLEEIKVHAVDDIDSEPTIDVARDLLLKFDIVYEDPDFRHSYSMLSCYLDQCLPDERDSLPVFIGYIWDLAEKREGSDTAKKVAKSIGKLLDHIELECVRLNRMEEVRYFAKRSSEQHEEACRISSQVKVDTEKLSEKVAGFHEQSITILGIFSAVVIGFMAELSLFTGGFNKLTPQNVYAVVFYCVIIGTIVFDTLFMLIFFISKIAGTSLSINTHPHTKGVWLFRTFSDYPYVYCFNIFTVIAAIALYIVNSRGS